MKQTILIVDDSLTIRKALEQRLREHGYKTQTAKNGRDALDKLKAVKNIDTILMDIEMPEMGGIEATRIIKSDPALFIPIIVLTSHDKAVQVAEGLDAGADDYISKKAEPVEVIARIRASLRVKYFHDELEKSNLQLKQTEKILTAIQTAADFGDKVGRHLKLIQQENPSESILKQINSIRKIIDEMIEEVTEKFSRHTENMDGFMSSDSEFEEF
ncbi:MAG: response regulator [Desulfobacteraceae bacterium]|nr:response regulator [Desulfobacteraceae bacterium]